MTSRTSYLLVAAALGVAMLVVLMARRHEEQQAAEPAAVGPTPYNVVLVTVDTLRADRLGVYGFEGVDTPAIDSLAGRGVTFLRAIAPVPLTLPSHASIFSGTYPLHHGVRDNVNFTVRDEITTMAEVFEQAGYQTAAFVGAYVLDSRWGLDQGFQTYSDDLEAAAPGPVVTPAQRPAEEVVDRALAWHEQRTEAPFFLWVHLYDPHDPYRPPEPFRSRYMADPYLGEIAYADSQLGRLLERLEQRGEMERTHLVFAADHGESLEEHGEPTHGFFVYEEALHVPLILTTADPLLQGSRRSQTVSLVDLMPTVLELTGLELPRQVQGRSLVPLFAEDATDWDRLVYSESFYARYNFGWSPLQAIQDARHKLILSSDPELYDLAEDPAESRNLVGQRNTLFARLNTAAELLIAQLGERAAAPEASQLDEEARQRLASLGYLGGSNLVVTEGDELASPRAKIDTYREFMTAKQHVGARRPGEAEPLLRGILADDPQVIEAYRLLGTLQSDMGRDDEAAALFKQAITYQPDQPEFFLLVARSQQRANRLVEAEQTLLDFLSAMPPDPRVLCMLGHIKRSQTDLDEAARYYEQTLALTAGSAHHWHRGRASPVAASAHNGLAAIYLGQARYQPAVSHAQSAVAIDDALPGAFFNLGMAYDKTRQPRAAIEAYSKELDRSPGHVLARMRLGVLHHALGESAEAEKPLRRAIDLNPELAAVYLLLARVIGDRGGDLQEALDLAELGLSKARGNRDRLESYRLLADLHGRMGNTELARQFAGRVSQQDGRQ